MSSIGDTVLWDGNQWKIILIEDRNTYEPIPNVMQIGNVVILENKEGKKIQLYDFDL
jgi:hypothetical protein